MKATSPIVLAICLLLAAALCPRTSRSAAGPKGATRESCPVVTVECPNEPVRPGVPVSFKAKVSGAGPARALTFKWVTSAGTITSGAEGSVTTGNGDAEFTAVVDTTGLPSTATVTAVVEVGGLDRSCSNASSCATGIVIHDPHPLDEYGRIKFEDEQARLDNFAITLQEVPEMDGYLVCYGGRTGRRGEARARCERAKRYLVGRRRLAPEKLVLVDGGYQEELTVWLWILPPGTNFTPTPTVDPKDVRFADATKRTKSKKRAPRQRHITP